MPDYLAYRYLIASEEVTLLVKKKSGGIAEIEIEKDEDDDLGIIAPPMRVRACNNHCVFCFVEQMPGGLRRSLYVKDEDYRHSFLYGNYVTMTTMKDEDFARIIRERLSPFVCLRPCNGRQPSPVPSGQLQGPFDNGGHKETHGQRHRAPYPGGGRAGNKRRRGAYKDD